MTEFENKMLLELLKMKEQELLLLANDERLKLKADAVKELANKCKDLSTEIYYVESMKYIGCK